MSIRNPIEDILDAEQDGDRSLGTIAPDSTHFSNWRERRKQEREEEEAQRVRYVRSYPCLLQFEHDVPRIGMSGYNRQQYVWDALEYDGGKMVAAEFRVTAQHLVDVLSLYEDLSKDFYCIARTGEGVRTRYYVRRYKTFEPAHRAWVKLQAVVAERPQKGKRELV